MIIKHLAQISIRVRRGNSFGGAGRLVCAIGSIDGQQGIGICDAVIHDPKGIEWDTGDAVHVPVYHIWAKMVA